MNKKVVCPLTCWNVMLDKASELFWNFLSFLDFYHCSTVSTKRRYLTYLPANLKTILTSKVWSILYSVGQGPVASLSLSTVHNKLLPLNSITCMFKKNPTGLSALLDMSVSCSTLLVKGNLMLLKPCYCCVWFVEDDGLCSAVVQWQASFRTSDWFQKQSRGHCAERGTKMPSCNYIY